MEYIYEPMSRNGFDEDGVRILKRICVIDVTATPLSSTHIGVAARDTRFMTIDGALTEVVIQRHPTHHFTWTRDSTSPITDLLLITSGTVLSDGSVHPSAARHLVHDLYWMALKADPTLHAWINRWFPEYWEGINP